MEKTFEKSEEQAEIIKMIALPVMMLDIKYCKEAAKDMMQQASRQESMMVLNPNHPQIKNDILRKQGEALRLLAQYAESIKEIQRLKSELSKEQETRERINKMFV